MGKHVLNFSNKLATVTCILCSLGAHLICQNLVKASFAFGSFMHSICEYETGFAKPSKPVQEVVLLTKPEAV